MKKWFLNALPFVAALMGFDAKAKEKLEFSPEDIAKLDAESKIEGFAEAFMKYHNEEYLKEEAGANDAFAKFMAEFNANGPKVEASAEGEEAEEEAAEGIPTADAKTLAEKLRAVIKKADGLLKTNAQQAADIEKLKKLPEDDEPEAIINMNSKKSTVKHSDTHLFGSNQSWDALDRPWNKAAASGEMKGATVWDKVNIDKLNSDLGAYARRNSNEIMSMLMDGYEIPKNWNVISNVQDQYVFSSIVSGEITQAFKKAWLPKNNQRFVPIINKIYDKQIDITWEASELKSIEKSWLNMFFNEGSTPYKDSFAAYLIGELLKKARKEDKISIFKGVYSDTSLLPDGTSGSFLNAMNGFLKIISDHRDVNYKAHSLGKPTTANITTYIKDWVMSLPYDFRTQQGLVLGLSDDWHKAHHNARELAKGTNTDYTPNNSFVDQFPNIQFQPLAQLNGSDFMYITTNDNIGLMVDRPGEESMITLEKNRRVIDAFADYKLGVYIKALGAAVDASAPITYENQIFFSNDVEVLTDVYVPVASNDATPSVATHTNLIIGSNNTSATNITKLDDVVAGKIYHLYGDADSNVSTVKNGSDIILLNGDFALNTGSKITLLGQSGGKVIEYARETAASASAPATIALAEDATTADASLGTHFVTVANSGATAFTNFTNAIIDEIYTLEGGSSTDATTVANSGNFVLTGAFTASAGAYLKVKYNGSKFIEVARG